MKQENKKQMYNIPLSSDGTIKLDELYIALINQGYPLEKLPDPYFMLSIDSLSRYLTFNRDVVAHLQEAEKIRDLVPEDFKWSKKISLDYLKECFKNKENSDDSLNSSVYKTIKKSLKCYDYLDYGIYLAIESLYNKEEYFIEDHNTVNYKRFVEFFEEI